MTPSQKIKKQALRDQYSGAQAQLGHTDLRKSATSAQAPDPGVAAYCLSAAVSPDLLNFPHVSKTQQDLRKAIHGSSAVLLDGRECEDITNVGRALLDGGVFASGSTLAILINRPLFSTELGSIADFLSQADGLQ
eukprot:scaffold182402_cov45-Prasinocladus_malaysianus.AAC.1